MKFGTTLRFAAASSMLAFGFQGTAYAHKIVHVQDTLYVIICEPGGEAYTFNGTSQGAGEVGNYICPPSGVAPSDAADNEVIQARPVTRDAASGLPTGKRRHKPLTVSKELDKSSPKLSEGAAGDSNPATHDNATGEVGRTKKLKKLKPVDAGPLKPMDETDPCPTLPCS